MRPYGARGSRNSNIAQTLAELGLFTADAITAYVDRSELHRGPEHPREMIAAGMEFAHSRMSYGGKAFSARCERCWGTEEPGNILWVYERVPSGSYESACRECLGKLATRGLGCSWTSTSRALLLLGEPADSDSVWAVLPRELRTEIAEIYVRLLAPG